MIRMQRHMRSQLYKIHESRSPSSLRLDLTSDAIHHRPRRTPWRHLKPVRSHRGIDTLWICPAPISTSRLAQSNNRTWLLSMSYQADINGQAFYKMLAEYHRFAKPYRLPILYKLQMGDMTKSGRYIRINRYSGEPFQPVNDSEKRTLHIYYLRAVKPTQSIPRNIHTCIPCISNMRVYVVRMCTVISTRPGHPVFTFEIVPILMQDDVDSPEGNIPGRRKLTQKSGISTLDHLLYMVEVVVGICARLGDGGVKVMGRF